MQKYELTGRLFIVYQDGEEVGRHKDKSMAVLRFSRIIPKIAAAGGTAGLYRATVDEWGIISNTEILAVAY